MDIEKAIRNLASFHANDLDEKVKARINEMKLDKNEHFLVYKVLGITNYQDDINIDLYQNKGRLVYNHAGTFMEDAVRLCFKYKFGENNGIRKKIPNTLASSPKTYEIDCLVNDKDAHEIKWRDATTDGDHVHKEEQRLRVIQEAGYKPIRIMFFMPDRKQAKKIQRKLETLYENLGGSYYAGNEAFDYIKDYTSVDLKKILEDIAFEQQ